MRPLILLFPGQSSRDAGMFERLSVVDPAGASDALATFEKFTGAGFQGRLRCNLEVQMAVFLATLAYLGRLEQEGIQIDASAGMSLGEYAHLVHIGSLPRDHAVSLVAARGRAYDGGPDGIMVAVQPTNGEELAPFLAQVRTELRIGEDDLAISNFNSRRQVVVAGRADAVERLIVAIDEALYPDTVTIEKHVPMHTGRFRPVVDVFRPALESVDWQPPALPWWPNVLGEPIEEAGPERFVELLSRHVCEPVQWEKTVDGLFDAHPDPVILEVGPRQILRDLIRGWRRRTPVFSVDSGDALTFDDVLEEVHRARR